MIKRVSLTVIKYSNRDGNTVNKNFLCEEKERMKKSVQKYEIMIFIFLPHLKKCI